MKLNPKQYQATTHPPGPLLILAGAGTGKTTTIVERMAYMINDAHIEPKSILALTFTVKAAEHLKEKLIEKVGEKGSDLHASTFHSFAQSIVEEFKEHLNFERKPRLMNQSDINFMIREHFDELDIIESELFKRNPIKAIKALKVLFDQFREELLSVEQLRIYQSSCEENLQDQVFDDKTKAHYQQLKDALKIFPYYQAWKIAENRMDYGDMISNLWSLFKNAPEVKLKLQERFQFIIVDEFQDNNHALSQVIQELAYPENHITVVGDDDQCIYSFRGANIQNINEFQNTYHQNKEYAEIPLMQNYRSNQPILNLANAVIQLNPDRVEKGKLRSDKKSSEIPKLYLGNKSDQLWQIKYVIKDHLLDGSLPEDITVLTRTHGQCRAVSTYLYENGMQNQYFADKLFNMKIIKDVIAGIHILGETQHQAQSIYRLIKKKFGDDIASTFSRNYYQNQRSRSLDEICYSTFKNNDSILKWYEFGKQIQKNLTDLSIGEVLEQLYKWIGGYRDNFNKMSLAELKNIYYLNQFSEQVFTYDRSYPKSSFKHFVRYLNVSVEINEINVEPLSDELMTGVQVMTVHQSKGKEFKHVIIPFLRSNSFPLTPKYSEFVNYIPVEWRNWEIGDRDVKDLHYEEERRIMYVALTRAIESLKLLGPEKSQSRFIKDIPETILKRETIMSTETVLDKFQIMKTELQNQLIEESNNGHWEMAQHLIEAMEFVTKIKNNEAIEWAENPLKKSILKKLNLAEENYNIPNPLQLSATKINTYQKCPLQYRFSEIDKIPSISKKPYFELGSIIHTVLEMFHKENKSTESELLDLLEEYWEIDSFIFDQEETQYRKDAEDMLKNYHRYLKEYGAHPHMMEEKFSYKLSNCVITGKCDRIDLNPMGGIEIYDYKTSKSQKTEREMKKDIQMAVYAMYAWREGVEMPDGHKEKTLPDKLSLLSLRHETPEVFIQYTPEELTEKQIEIEAIANKINQQEFPAITGFHCDHCEFKELICPEFDM